MEPSEQFQKIDKTLRRRPSLLGNTDHFATAFSELRKLPPTYMLLGSGRLLAHRWESIRDDAERTFEGGLATISDREFDTLKGTWWAGWPEMSVWVYSVRSSILQTLDVQRNRNFYRVLTLSHNGHNRELALRELAKSPTALDWPFALSRLHDWVPQVREAAQKLTEALLQSEHREEIARWPAQLSSLVLRHRSASSGIVDRIIEFASRSGALLPIWLRLGQEFRRHAVRILADRSLMTEDLLEAVLRSNDTGTIREALDRHTATFDRTAEMLSHPSPIARNYSLEAYAKRAPGEVEVVKKALVDSSSRVRKTAQALLKNRGIDPRPLYLGMLEAGVASRPVIEGFCEVATNEDKQRLLGILATGSARRRFASARVLLGLDVEEILPTLFHDGSGRVRRLAVEYVQAHPLVMDLTARQELLQSPEPEVQRTGMVLLMSLARWPSLPWILRFLAHEQEEVRNTAFEYLRRWLWWASHSPSIPSMEVFRATWAEFEMYRQAVPRGVRTQLESILHWVEGQLGSK